MPRNIVSAILREGLYTQVIGRRILFFQRLSSTMEEAARQAGEDAEEGTVVIAEEQEAGRGRFQRAWVSAPGNLYLSIVLHPSLFAMQYLSIISGLAVVRAIRKTTEMKPTLKWPNDVRIGGKKVCGVLVESAVRGDRVEYGIVGIGINVDLNTDAVDGLADIATSLNKESRTKVDREVLLKNLLHEMDRLYVALREPLGPSHSATSGLARGGPTLQGVMEEWRGLLETLGSQVEVRWQNEIYTGFAEDVDQVGNLLLRRGDGALTTLPAGEVTTVTAP